MKFDLSAWVLNIQCAHVSPNSVDDSVVFLKMLGNILEFWGCEVCIAKNGLKAIEAVKKKKYNLCLLDLRMPVLGGYGTSKRIYEIDQELPFVAMTALSTEKDRAKTKLHGFVYHLNKPFNHQQLFNAISQWARKD